MSSSAWHKGAGKPRSAPEAKSSSRSRGDAPISPRSEPEILEPKENGSREGKAGVPEEADPQNGDLLDEGPAPDAHAGPTGYSDRDREGITMLDEHSSSVTYADGGTWSEEPEFAEGGHPGEADAPEYSVTAGPEAHLAPPEEEPVAGKNEEVLETAEGTEPAEELKNSKKQASKHKVGKEVQHMLFDPSTALSPAGSSKDPYRPRYKVAPRTIRVAGTLILTAVGINAAYAVAAIAGTAPLMAAWPTSYLASILAALAGLAALIYAGRGDSRVFWPSIAATFAASLAGAPPAALAALAAAYLARKEEAREWII